jgi:hypothetical protein
MLDYGLSNVTFEFPIHVFAQNNDFFLQIIFFGNLNKILKVKTWSKKPMGQSKSTFPKSAYDMCHFFCWFIT